MTHADDVLTLMDSLRLTKAHVVGLSMGAFVAGDLLAMHPERLLSCTMASGGIRNSRGPSEPMDSAESARRDKEIEALKEKGIDKMKEEWINSLMASGGSQRERMRQPLTQMIADWTAWQPLHKEVRLFYGREAWQQLTSQENTTPTLLLRGANEMKGKSGQPRELQYLKKGRYVVIPDCGHMLNMERPDDFNRTLLDFLTDTAEPRY
jgi:pimeloyl-ACP methyl ester carboxylesterase